MYVKQKLNIKSLGKKRQPLKDLESDLSNKEVAKKYTLPTKSRELLIMWFRDK